MNNAIVNFPVPANEPVKPYLEGSPERIALDAELKRQFNTVVDIPIIIGGKEIRTGNIGKGSIHVAEDGDKYVNGLFLLKDDWERPASCSFRPGTSADFSTNIYTTGDSPEDFDGSWQEMEAAGAVFLPAAGNRNIYLNVFDQFAKRELGCRHYGRYVDDFYVVSGDPQWLMGLVPRMKAFLRERLGLTLPPRKTVLRRTSEGVPFLGAFVKPGRCLLHRRSAALMQEHLKELFHGIAEQIRVLGKYRYLCKRKEWTIWQMIF